MSSYFLRLFVAFVFLIADPVCYSTPGEWSVGVIAPLLLVSLLYIMHNLMYITYMTYMMCYMHIYQKRHIPNQRPGKHSILTPTYHSDMMHVTC
jgi:hypothetical protein